MIENAIERGNDWMWSNITIHATWDPPVMDLKLTGLSHRYRLSFNNPTEFWNSELKKRMVQEAMDHLSLQVRHIFEYLAKLGPKKFEETSKTRFIDL